MGGSSESFTAPSAGDVDVTVIFEGPTSTSGVCVAGGGWSLPSSVRTVYDRKSTWSSLYSDVSTVDLLFNFLSQRLRDNTSLAFKDDTVLYGKFSLTLKFSETSFGTELLFSGHPLRITFEGLKSWIFSRFLLDFTQLLLGDS